MADTDEASLQRRRRVQIYFASIIVMIVLVNTPAPDIVIGALFGPTTGDAIAQSLVEFTRDLFLLLLVSLYFEWARSRGTAESIDEIQSEVSRLSSTIQAYLPSNLKAAITRDFPPSEVVMLGAQAALQTSKSTESIALQLSGDWDRLEDVTVDVRLRPDEDGARVRVRSTMTATTDATDLLVAVTTSGQMAKLLASQSRDLLSVIVIPGRPISELRTDDLTKRFAMSYRAPNGRFDDSEFISLPDVARDELVPLPAGMSNTDVVVFRAQIPQNISQSKTIRTQFSYTLPTEGQIFTWRADRPMFISQISIDAAAIGAVRFDTYLPDLERIRIDTADERIEINVDGWLLSGHGIAVTWNSISRRES